MSELEPCRKCGSRPVESLQQSGRAFVSYGCCEIRTKHYKGRKTAKRVWNRWQTGGPLHPDLDCGEVKNIGYDIDGVLANFMGALMRKARQLGYKDEIPGHWMQLKRYHPEGEGYQEAWDLIADQHSFWRDQIHPYDDAYIHTDVTAYITNRSVPSSLTQEWLLRHGFPNAPVNTVGHDHSKVRAAEVENLDLFIDDKPEIVRNMNDHGIPCLLMDRPYNHGEEDLDHLRIRCLSQVKKHVS